MILKDEPTKYVGVAFLEPGWVHLTGVIAVVSSVVKPQPCTDLAFPAERVKLVQWEQAA